MRVWLQRNRRRRNHQLQFISELTLTFHISFISELQCRKTYHIPFIIEPQRQKTYLRTCARSEDLEQFAHSPILIWNFAERIFYCQECRFSSCRKQTLIRLCGRTDWFKSLFGPYVRRYVAWRCGLSVSNLISITAVSHSSLFFDFHNSCTTFFIITWLS